MRRYEAVSERVEASIRPEQSGDAAAVDTLLRCAFGRDGEAELVARLRREERPDAAAGRMGQVRYHPAFEGV